MMPKRSSKDGSIGQRCARTLRRCATMMMAVGCGFVVSMAGRGQAHAAEAQSFYVLDRSRDDPHAAKLYQPLPYQARNWEICVAFPHIKDSYWLAANYGISDQAKRLGVGMRLYHAGGYDNADLQIRQVRECVANGGDAVVLASVSHDNLNPLIAELAAQHIPVVDLINGISSRQVKARSTVSFADMGAHAGRYIARFHPQGSPPVKVAWFPGPYGAGWVKDGDQGFRDALQSSSATIVSTSYGDTGKSVQRQLMAKVLSEYPDVSFIAGTAVTAEAAVNYLRRVKPAHPVTVVSYYFTPAVYRAIRRGQVLAAPTDSPVLQARIAMDQAVRILEGQPYEAQVSPIIHTVNAQNVRSFDRSTSLAPSGFRPTFIIHRGRE